LLIKYKDLDDNVTERIISKFVPEKPNKIKAYCHLRNDERIFYIDRILLASNPKSGKVVNNLYKFFGLKLPKLNKKLNKSDKIKIKSNTTKLTTDEYKQLRKIEKNELFDRFRVPLIVDLYKQKFFTSFGNKCYKCKQIGNLVIDHHVPLVLGGHFVPGNLVALCRRCNNKKKDKYPKEFYSKRELSQLHTILKKQSDIFNFKFDWNRWEADPREYLISLGIDSNLVNEIFTNKNHQYFIEPSSSRYKVALSVNLDDFLNEY
jgi:5-methylcytosine-specific restriction endonuclease McrA